MSIKGTNRKCWLLFSQMWTFLVVISLAGAASAESATEPPAKNVDEKRYIVFPGLDAAADEIAEWATGWASPFNVYFGPKPYVVGWLGEGGGFGPDDPEIDGPDYEDDDSSYEDDDDDDDDDDDPDFDPEDFYPEKNG